MNIYRIGVLLLLAITVFFAACENQGKSEASDDKLLIVCTTGMVGDAARNLLPSGFKVISIMGPGVDPHLYKARASDLSNFQDASLIIYNGLHLEGRLAQSLEHYAEKKPVFAMAEEVDTAQLIPSAEKVYDPHIWFDVSLWAEAVKSLSDYLIETYEEDADSIRILSNQYLRDLEALDEEVHSMLAGVSEERRILVTAHDAFEYFGKRYNFRVEGLQGISTAAEYGVKDVTNLIQLLIDEDVPAVFIESSIPKKSIEAVIEGCKRSGHNVVLGGSLFSDAMGDENSEEGTYRGMVLSNARTISGALKN